MRGVLLSKDVVPVSEFKAHASKWFKRAQATGPVVVTQNGRVAGVVLSSAEYDRLTERERVVERVDRGLRDVEAGRSVPHEEALRTMKARWANKGKT